MFQNFSKKQIIAGITIIVIFLAIVAYAIVTLVYRSGKNPVKTAYAPFNSQVSIDGRKISNNSTNYIAPGTYELTVELEHFESVAMTITIAENGDSIVGNLVPIDEEGEKIKRERSADYQRVEGIMGELAAESGRNKIQNYPILQYLPINNMLFSISFQTQNDGSPKINIKAKPTYYDSAVNKLYSFGEEVSPAQYVIEIIDYVGPFDNIEFISNSQTSAVDFISEGYREIIDDYTIVRGEKVDDYYYLALKSNIGIASGMDQTYRIILHTKDKSWEFVSKPYPVLSRFNVDGVPDAIVDAVNQL